MANFEATCDNHNSRRAVKNMKTPSHESNAVHVPPDLLAEVREAATEEHRPADELVSDAVRRYLRERKPNTHAPQKKKPCAVSYGLAFSRCESGFGTP